MKTRLTRTPFFGDHTPVQDLAFYTTQELIAELLNRKTFLGVIVHSEKELKGDHWGEERIFKVNFNSNLDTGRVSRLLDRVAGYLTDSQL